MGGTPRGAKITNICNERLLGERHFLTSLQNVKKNYKIQNNKNNVSNFSEIKRKWKETNVDFWIIIFQVFYIKNNVMHS